jgi:hypothetical protein
MGHRVGYEGGNVQVLGTLSSNEQQGGGASGAMRVVHSRSARRSKGQGKGACENSPDRQRRGRSSGRRGCPTGPARSGKRRVNQNSANRRTHRQCGVHSTAVDQLSLMLAASQLGAPPPPPPLFSGDFVLTGDVIFNEDDDDDDAGCEEDHYTARAREAAASPQHDVEEPDPEQDAIAAALAQTYDTTNTMLEEHATRHQECILQRWRAQQQHYNTQNNDPQQHHSSHTNEPSQDISAPHKLELIDEIEDTDEDIVDQLTPTGSRSTGKSGSQSPVADAPDSPADDPPVDGKSWGAPTSAKDAVAAEQVAQAEELKEQGHALMAAGDYINAGGIFGIARTLNPDDAELPELEATADRMAESAVESVHRPATKRCSQYSRMYDAWLSSGRPEMRSSAVSMAVC